MHSNSRAIALLAWLIAGTLSVHAATIVPLWSIDGVVDAIPVSCRQTAPALQITKGSAGYHLTVSCGTPMPIDCVLGSNDALRLALNGLDFSCHTPSSTGALRAMHLPQVTTVAPGGGAAMQVQVFNGSSQPLTNLSVSSSEVPTCAALRASLAGGAVWSYACFATDVSRPTVNRVRVQARTAAGGTLTAHASAQLLVDEPRIGLDVSPAAQRVSTGGTARWTVTVGNEGPVPLTHVLEADSLIDSTCYLGPIGNLPAGYGARFECVRTNVRATFSSLHEATGRAGSELLEVRKTVAVHVGNQIIRDGFDIVLFRNGFETP